MIKRLVYLTGFIFWGTAVLAQEPVMHFFPRTAIRITEGVFKNAEETDTRYMLSLNADRLLAPYLREAGLTPKIAPYHNWENTGLDGHIGGHYLSALASMYAATGNPGLRERLLYMVSELRRCQHQAGTGYIGGVPGGIALWKEIAAGKISAQSFSLNNHWVPWYNLHKLFAGLYDAYQYAGVNDAKEMLICLGSWWMDISKKLSDEQIETMLRAEFGGMNEVFVHLYQLTGEDRYLAEARRFAHKAILEPLIKQQDQLNGLHANTQIPKVIGYQQTALLTGDQELMKASLFFWNNVVQERSVAIGGNSTREMFNPKNDFTRMLLSKEGPETCNTYNMLKLTGLLYKSDPAASFIDFYEKATFNHILSTQHPQKGGFVYFTSMRPQHYRNYSQSQQGFWCCVGSGLENHSKYGELIYTYNKEALFVNLFIPSALTWKEQGVTLTQSTGFPHQDHATLTVNGTKPGNFTLAIRQPEWLSAAMTISINGKRYNNYTIKKGYLYISRQWKSNDVIRFSLPMKLAVEAMPDGSPWVAFKYGPVVLAATAKSQPGDIYFADSSRMGHIADGSLIPLDATDPIRFDTAAVKKYIRKDKNGLRFTMYNPSSAQPLILQPFYTIHEQRYTIYWPLLTAGKSGIGDAEQQLMLADRMSVDRVALGEQQPESDHGFSYSQSESGIWNNINWRSTSDSISYWLNNKKGEGRSLVIRYIADKDPKNFDIYWNDLKMNKPPVDRSDHPQLKTMVLTLDAVLMKSLANQKIPVAIKAQGGRETPRLVEIRLSKE